MVVIFLCALFPCLGCDGDDGNGNEPPTSPTDEAPPARVEDLAVTVEGDSAVALTWTAPGDDGASGTAASYDIRHSESPISEENWEGATQADGEPDPADAGSVEWFAFSDTIPDASLFFGLKASDEAGNESVLSNVVLLDINPPAPVDDLEPGGVTSQSVNLRWSAPPDNTGEAVSYELRYSTSPITEETWEDATIFPDPPDPRTPGSREVITVYGLRPETLYYFGIRSVDGSGNLSPLSNVIAITTSAPPEGWWDGFDALGLSDGVDELFPFEGKLFAGGAFIEAGPVEALHIAAWDGEGWSPMGAGFSGGRGTTVTGLAVYDGGLVAVGFFDGSGDTELHNVARWSGSEWTPLGSGVDGLIFDATEFEGDLYIGGVIVTLGDESIISIARWDGKTWSGMGWNLFASFGISDLLVHEGDLIVSGTFTRAADTAAVNIARWDGETWSPLGEGLGDGSPLSIVQALTVYEGDLVAAGNFTTSGGAPLRGVARWDGESWSQVGTDPPGGVNALTVYNGDLIAGGDFTTAGGQTAKNIARWDGNAWVPLGEGLAGGMLLSCRELEVYHGSLYAGGAFQKAGIFSSRNIAKWDD